jgi:hypothetical protein
MKFIKVYLFLFIILFLGTAAIFMLFLKNYIYYSKSVYGDRLQGIEEVVINTELKKSIEDNMLEMDGIESSTINVRGRIINIIVGVNNSIDIGQAKVLTDEILGEFDDDYKNFYDIQFFITQQESTDNSEFPIIGYKNKASEIILWGGA